METVDLALYLVAAPLQLAALIFAVRVAREVSDRRPWAMLFAALSIMFAFRVAARCSSATTSSGTRRRSPPSRSRSSCSWPCSPSAGWRSPSGRATRSPPGAPPSATRASGAIARSWTSAPTRCSSAPTARSPTPTRPRTGYFAPRTRGAVRCSPLDLTSATSRAAVEARFRRMEETGSGVPTASAEFWCRLDGTDVAVEGAAAVVPWQGGTAIQVILRDITERHAAEEERSNCWRASGGPRRGRARQPDEGRVPRHALATSCARRSTRSSAGRRSCSAASQRRRTSLPQGLDDDRAQRPRRRRSSSRTCWT